MRKLLPNKSALQAARMQNQNGIQCGILSLISLRGLLGCDKQDRESHKGILTWTSLNGLLGSD